MFSNFVFIAKSRKKGTLNFRLNPQSNLNIFSKELICLMGAGKGRRGEKFHGINYKLIRSSFCRRLYHLIEGKIMITIPATSN